MLVRNFHTFGLVFLCLFPLQSVAFTTTATTTPITTKLFASTMTNTETGRVYSLADQEERFSRAKRENNQRYLDITTVYDPSKLKGLRVVVTGANKGNGLALAKELKSAGAHVIAVTRSMSDELKELEPAQIIRDIDVTNDESCAGLASKIEGGPVDIVSTHTRP